MIGFYQVSNISSYLLFIIYYFKSHAQYTKLPLFGRV